MYFPEKPSSDCIFVVNIFGQKQQTPFIALQPVFDVNDRIAKSF